MSNDHSHSNRPFNAQSTDAMFATVLERLSEQKDTLFEIRSEVRKTNGRVSSLEHWRTGIKAKIALASAGISAVVALVAWVIEQVN